MESQTKTTATKGRKVSARPDSSLATHRERVPVARATAVFGAGTSTQAIDRAPARDSYAQTAMADVVDRSLHSTIARFTGGFAPPALLAAYSDWALHLAASPGKRWQLGEKALKNGVRLAHYARTCALSGGGGATGGSGATGGARCIEPLPQDRRFSGEAWQRWPFNVMSQAFLLQQQWWHNATTGVRGVTPQHENALAFGSRQILDTFAPSNFVATNPEVIERTIREGGMNLVRGFGHFVEDLERLTTGSPAPAGGDFEVGRDLAVTPGKVVYRNRLIELIQYSPTTEKVRPEPILIVPAWIMKYYILDLSPQDSMVSFLVGQGYTVFMISWLNPGPEHRELGMDDYRNLGVMAALDAVGAIVPRQQVHAVGYCLGGTLLSIAAATMAREGDARLHSISLLAAQADFTEAGELTLFINESQLTFLEDMMWEQGYLDAKQMAGTFQLLRSNDLIWSRNLREYLMGERGTMNDMMAWNADATRMPYRMHAEYLRRLFLDNDLAEGRFAVDGRAVSLTDIRAPIFAVGTITDHVAPWRSAYKIRHLTDTEVTFALTTGGHNAGIVSEPGHPRRSFQLETRAHDDRFLDADEWLARAPRFEGSWWTAWVAWLGARSGVPVEPPSMGAPEMGFAPICEAPGTYVFGK